MGVSVGTLLGFADGILVGVFVGILLGLGLGKKVGSKVEGNPVNCDIGSVDGLLVSSDGSAEYRLDGFLVGKVERSPEWRDDGV